MRVAFGADHRGFRLKDALVQTAKELGNETRDCGTRGEERCDFPDYAHAVCRELREGRAELGVLVCGSGVGMSIAANKVAGIRAALCSTAGQAEMSRRHNDANVLCIGADYTDPKTARRMLESFLAGEFEGGRYGERMEKAERGL